MKPSDREELARKRILSVLGRQVVANARTLEQKISDAGPGGKRIDPHVLTPVRRKLLEEGVIQSIKSGNNTWFYLGNAPKDAVDARLKELLGLFGEFTTNQLQHRVGQTLEIATYRALLTVTDLEFYGRFKDLDAHDDSTLYSKEEPPAHIGSKVLPGNKLLDFIVRHPQAGPLGIECKNIREWVYPNREEITELFLKCSVLGAVPVLIARRIPFVTFKLLSTVGAIVHQTYNQFLPETESQLADKFRQKELLGYHDIRTGNQPDARLSTFVTKNMLAVAPAAREKFEVYKDLLNAFGTGEMEYAEFAARVRRRNKGTKEDNDWPEETQSNFSPE